MRALRWMVMGPLGLGLAVASAFADRAQAEIRYDSSVRKAAIERMQEKLGTLRGTIKPGSPNVRLTEQMIDLLAPIRAKDGVVEALPARAPFTAPSIDQTVSSAQPGVDSTRTASTGRGLAGSPQAGSSDARSILAAVEEIMRNDR